jgi:cell division inhibitor SepF
MAGAMRRMGIYLGLVEDDDTRGYGRYDARQGDHPESDRRYERYTGEATHADDYDERYADDGYAADGYAEDIEVDRPAPLREPEPLSARRVAGPRPLGVAPGGAPAARLGGAGSASVAGAGTAAAGLAVREPVAAAPAPEPAPAPAPTPQPYRITTLHPRTYNEARVIGERFRDGLPVIMNLTEMDDADAKRLVDFAAGLSFGLRGSIERVTAKVFLLSPQNVDVTAEDKARIREGGFFNQS